MRVLVTGGAGQLGSELVRQLIRAGLEVVATSHRRPVRGCATRQIDVCDPGAVDALVADVRPAAVIHTAYDPADWDSTAVAPGHVAQACAKYGAKLTHISSDAVFDGSAPSYRETDRPTPINSYGAAKAAAEVVVRAVLPEVAIVRTSLILGGPDAPRERTVHELVAGTLSGVLFTDDIRCPVHVSDLAAAVLELIGTPGVHHVAGADAVSRFEIGELVCRRDGLDATRLRPGLRADLPVPGPLDLRLDCSATQRLLDIRLRGAREFLASDA